MCYRSRPPTKEMMTDMDVYQGRLVADGFGHLLADEGDRAGHPVAHDVENGVYVFIGLDELSHNDRHHRQFVTLEPLMEDDPSPDTDSEVSRRRYHPDAIAPTVTGHTSAYTGGE